MNYLDFFYGILFLIVLFGSIKIFHIHLLKERNSVKNLLLFISEHPDIKEDYQNRHLEITINKQTLFLDMDQQDHSYNLTTNS
jgi:hypothetical protein